MTLIALAILLFAVGAGAIFNTGRQVERVGFSALKGTDWIVGLAGIILLLAGVAIIAHH